MRMEKRENGIKPGGKEDGRGRCVQLWKVEIRHQLKNMFFLQTTGKYEETE